tara:strand:- start:1937 stop:2539 length:603 start_codon:yes stop_codon:yes gene_type:complete
MPYNERYDNIDFLKITFGTLIGAGFGALLGLSAKPFLAPITSAILSNMPLLPHLVFLPTFTGPLIVTCFAVACGYAAYSWLSSDNTEENESLHTPEDFQSDKSNHSSTNNRSNTHNDDYVGGSAGIPFGIPLATRYPSPDFNNHFWDSNFRPTQQNASASSSAHATRFTPNFGTSSYSPQRATTSNSTVSGTAKPSFQPF